MDYSIVTPRKRTRMSEYDYKQSQYYFVTVCTAHKNCIFGEAEKPNRYGKIADQGIQDIPKHFEGVCVDEYVVMPNHIHMILILSQGQSNLSDIVGSYKSYVSKMFHMEHKNVSVWQRSFYDHVIRSETAYLEIKQYIRENPIKWNLDEYNPRFQINDSGI